MTDTIRIGGVRRYDAHGVLAEEELRAQPFVADVEMEVESAAVGSIGCTASYTDVVADALAVIEGESADFVETLVDHIAERVLAHGALRATVTIHKPEALVGVPFFNVSVTVHRDGPPVDGGMIRRIVLAPKSNLEGGCAHLDAAVEAFGALNLHLTAVSSCLSTDPLFAPE